jgi:hypothetical protein
MRRRLRRGRRIDPSLPGLTRQSIEKRLFAKIVDGRVKPGHDDLAAKKQLPQRLQNLYQFAVHELVAADDVTGL